MPIRSAVAAVAFGFLAIAVAPANAQAPFAVAGGLGRPAATTTRSPSA